MLVPEIPQGCSALEAALLYADAGIYVGPTDPRATKVAADGSVQTDAKNPGNILGGAWQKKTSKDPDVIRGWYAKYPHAGVFIHAGRSGLVMVDVDDPAILARRAPWLAGELAASITPRQRTDKAGVRKHYVFRQPKDRTLGNSTASLKKMGLDIRGRNGIVVVEPTPRFDKPDGEYRWESLGKIEPLPEAIAAHLKEGAEGAPPATSAEVEKFLDEHTAEKRPKALRPIVQSFEHGARHETMYSALCWAFREAAAGCFPARKAHDELMGEWLEAFPEGIGRRPGVGEWEQMVSNSVGNANDANPQDTMAKLNRDSEFNPDFAPAREGEDDSSEGPSSWRPDVDAINALLDGEFEDVKPEWLRREDGHCLFYSGLVHWMYGESESGKSWVAKVAVAQALSEGHRVIYIDFESRASTVYSRLMKLGVEKELLRPGKGVFVYIHPLESIGSRQAREDFEELISESSDLVIMDGVTDAFSLSGTKSNEGDDVTEWIRRLPRKIAAKTGAGVVCIDHVTKDKENRGRFAIGSQAKMAAIDGAAFLVEPISVLAPGQVGEVSIQVTKDREGGVRAHAGGWDKDRKQEVARIKIDSTADDGSISFEVNAPPPEEVKAAKESNAIEVMAWKIVKAIETYGPLTFNGVKDKVTGNTDNRKKALERLVDLGYINIVEGARNSKNHALTDKKFGGFFGTISELHPTREQDADEGATVA